MRGNARGRSLDVQRKQRTMPVEPAPATGIGWRALMPVWATVFTGLLWLSSIRPFVRTIADDLNTSVSMIGQVTTAALLTMAVVSLFSGPLAEHYGYRRTIIGGLLIYAASAVLISASTTYVVVIGGGILGGLAGGMTYGIAFAVVMNQFKDGQQRGAIGYTQAVAGSATVLAPPLLAGIAALALWRGSFVAVALISLASAVIVVRWLPADPPVRGRRDSAAAILHAYRPVFTSPVMVRLYGASALRAMVGLGIPAYMGAYYADQFGFSLQEIGIAAMVEGAGLVAGSALAGTSLGRLDSRKLFTFGMLAVGVGWVIVLSGQFNPILTVGLSTALIFTAGVASTTIMNMLAQETPCRPATTMALNMSMVGFGGALGGFYGGIVLQLANYPVLGIAVLPFSVLTAYLVWNKDAPVLVVARLRSATQYLR